MIMAKSKPQGYKALNREEVTMDVEYTFAHDDEQLLCKETLVVSDEYPKQKARLRRKGEKHRDPPKRESHYRLNHPKNNGLCWPETYLVLN